MHFFLFLLRNIDCGYWLELPHWGISNEYPQSMFWAEIWKRPEFFIWKFSFLGGIIFNIFEYVYFWNGMACLTAEDSLEEPQQGISNKYPQHVFMENWRKLSQNYYQIFLLKKFSVSVLHCHILVNKILLFIPSLPLVRRTYCFWCGSSWCWHWHQRWHRRHTFLSAQYLVNQWLDFYQIFMNIYFGHNKELFRFW